MNGVGLVVLLLVVSLLAAVIWFTVPRLARRSRRRGPDLTLDGLALAVAGARAVHESLPAEPERPPVQTVRSSAATSNTP